MRLTPVTHQTTFLILDDEEDNRILVRYALQKAFPGAEVLEFAHPDEAIAAAANFQIDGVITDHHLGTKDGLGIIQQLRSAGVSCPVIMVTASSDPAVFRRAYEAGAAKVFAGSNFDFVGYLRSVIAR